MIVHSRLMKSPRAVSPALEGAAVVSAFAMLALVMTYPLILRTTDHLPSDVGDPVLNTWILGWDAARMRHGFGGIWDAPNFFPYRHTLTWSDHLFGIALFTAPIQWLTGNPVLAYNVAFLLVWVFPACGMYVLVRSLTGRADAAFIAAVLYTWTPFRFAHVSHLQWLMTGWLPLGLWALHRYFRSGAWRFALTAGGCFLLQALTASYFMYFALLPFGFVSFAELRTTTVPRRRIAAQAAVVLVLVAAAVIPVARAYTANRQQYGMRRSMTDIAEHSADFRDVLAASPLAPSGRLLRDGGSEHSLFPGFVTLALALAGALAFRRRRVVAVYVAIAFAALIFALGPEPAAWGHRLPFPGPYRLLLAVVPGLDGLRAPARLATALGLALDVLAGFGAAFLLQRSSGGGAGAVAAVVLIAALAEGWTAPMPVAAFKPGGAEADRAAYEYLRSQPPGAALELPIGGEDDEFRYQYMTLVHGHAVVNGHSGYLSPLLSFLSGGHSPLAEADHFDSVLSMASALGVRYVLLHSAGFRDRTTLGGMLASVEKRPECVVAVRSFGDVMMFTLSGVSLPQPDREFKPIATSALRVSASHGADRLGFLFDGDFDSRWLTGSPQHGGEWIDIQLDRPRDVAMISMTLAERSFGDYPRRLSIDVTDEAGTREAYEGPSLPHFARGLLANPQNPSIDVVLASNHARAIRVRQTSTTRRFFWSIHELRVWER
jgi:hypothetical protein